MTRKWFVRKLTWNKEPIQSLSSNVFPIHNNIMHIYFTLYSLLLLYFLQQSTTTNKHRSSVIVYIFFNRFHKTLHSIQSPADDQYCIKYKVKKLRPNSSLLLFCLPINNNNIMITIATKSIYSGYTYCRLSPSPTATPSVSRTRNYIYRRTCARHDDNMYLKTHHKVSLAWWSSSSSSLSRRALLFPRFYFRITLWFFSSCTRPYAPPPPPNIIVVVVV